MGAIQYALNQEQEVYRILENGAFDLDKSNNAIERTRFVPSPWEKKLSLRRLP